MNESSKIYELSLKLFSDFANQEMLEENSLKGLINEEVSNSELEELRKTIKDKSEVINSYLTIAKQNKMSYFADYVSQVLKGLENANKIVSEIDFEEEPESYLGKIKASFGKSIKIGDLLQSVMSLLNQSDIVSTAVADSFDKITNNFEGKNVPDETVIKDITEEQIGVSPEKLAKAIRGSLNKAINKPKGIMGKLKGFFKTDAEEIMKVMVGSDIEVNIDKLTEDILNLTYGQLKGTASEASEAAEDALNTNLDGEALKSVATGDVPEESGESESESEVSSEESDPSAQIKAVASEAGSTQMSPKDAVSKALDDWEKSLSKSSREALGRKKRNVALKDAVFSGIDKGKAAVKKAVAKAVKDWRSENEESLIKSKRFAKKNFDTLQQLIPQLASEILAQTKESSQTKISKGQIKKYVFNRLNSTVKQKLLHETWLKNASL